MTKTGLFLDFHAFFACDACSGNLPLGPHPRRWTNATGRMAKGGNPGSFACPVDRAGTSASLPLVRLRRRSVAERSVGGASLSQTRY
jgi:hypothetical protein